MYITLIFTLGNGVVKLFLSVIKNEKSQTWKIEVPAKCKLASIESIVLEAINGSDIPAKDSITINRK